MRLEILKLRFSSAKQCIPVDEKKNFIDKSKIVPEQENLANKFGFPSLVGWKFGILNWE